MTTLEVIKSGKLSFVDLGKKEKMISNKNCLQFIKNVKRTSSVLAPRDTDFMVSTFNIKTKKISKNTTEYLFTTMAGYAKFQEDGFAPHPIFIANSKKITPGMYIVRNHTSFVKPSVRNNLLKLSQDLNKGIKEAIKT